MKKCFFYVHLVISLCLFSLSQAMELHIAPEAPPLSLEARNILSLYQASTTRDITTELAHIDQNISELIAESDLFDLDSLREKIMFILKSTQNLPQINNEKRIMNPDPEWRMVFIEKR